MSARGTAFITGASSGIGAEFARRLAAQGYDLILHGRRRERLEKIRETLTRDHGVRIEFVTAELSDPARLLELERLIRSTADLSLLINNAGYSTIRYFEEEESGGQESLIRVNVVAPVRLTRAAIPVMRARGGGAIINVSSVAGFFIGPGSATYCATKAYLTNFTETLHLELEGSGIRVQALCPGFTITEFHSRLGFKTDEEFFKDFMTVEEVVERSSRDLARGKVVSVPGFRYRFAIAVARFIPRPVMYRLVTAVRRAQRARGGLPI